MKTKIFRMIAACFVMALLTSCGTREDTLSDDALLSSSGIADNEDKNLSATPAPDTVTLLSMDEAARIAQTDAGVTEGDLKSLHTRLEEGDSGKEYTITFATTEKVFEYLIAATDGMILEKHIDTMDVFSGTESFSVEETAPEVSAAAPNTVTPEVTIAAESTPVPKTTAAAEPTPVPKTTAAAEPTPVPKTTAATEPTPVPDAATQIAGITQDEAVAIARKDAGVSESEVLYLKVELDSKNGIRVYEIDFTAGNTEYEYDIAVSDGSIVNKKSELSGRVPADSPNPPAQTTGITQDEAVAVARKDAGVSESEVLYLKVELDSKNGIRVYEIDFTAGNTEYEYDIAVSDGSIVNKKSELSGRVPATSPNSSAQTANITQDEAVAIARKDAGVSESEVLNLKAKLDTDDGIRVYEINFTAGNKKYEYKISALDGTVLEKDIDTTAERLPTGTSSNANVSVGTEITKDAALAVVKTEVGISEREMLDLEIKLDYDDGIRFYEIEFCYDGYEYEYKIATSNGEIIKKECDRCNHSWHNTGSKSTK